MGLIYVDACLLIYLTEDHPHWGTAVARAIKATPDGSFGISPLVKMECLVGPLKRGDTALQHRYESLFDRFIALDMPEAVYLLAARLRARFGLKAPDALHLACAQHHHCSERLADSC